MQSTRSTAYPRSVGNADLIDVILAKGLEEQPAGVKSAIDAPSGSNRDYSLAAAMGILLCIGFSALLWGLTYLLLYLVGDLR